MLAEERDHDELGQRLLSRRALVKLAAKGTALAGLPAMVAACGSSGSVSSSVSSSQTTSAAATAVKGVPPAVASQLKQLLTLPTGKAAGQGLNLPLWTEMQITGFGAPQGHAQLTGVQLALDHIAAVGGPNYSLTVGDNQTGSATAGVSFMRRLGAAGVPAMLTTQDGDIGAEFPFYKEFQVIALDAGAAIKTSAKTPFYYMCRSLSGDQQIPGIAAFLQKERPEVKDVYTIGLDNGSVINADRIVVTKAALEAHGLNYAGTTFYPSTLEDFSPVIAKLRAVKPQAVICGVFGTTIGVFVKQYAASGLTAPLFGFDYLPDAAKLVPPGFENYYYATDYFDAYAPKTEWAKLFTQEYQRKFGTLPIYFAANYYETTFMLYALVRRLIAKGQDPSKQGLNYVHALEADPSFPSVYGTGGATGTLELDPVTHYLKRRVMAIFQAHGTKPSSVLATFNIGTTISEPSDFTVTT